MLGCVGTEQDPDAASRCDPSVLADRGVDDAGAPSDAVHVVELAVSALTHDCARMSDGTARCRGMNGDGQLGLGAVTPILDEATPVPDLTGVAQIVTSSNRATCTRHDDGTVRCWGSNEYGMLGTGHVGEERCGIFDGTPCRTRPTLVPGLDRVTQLFLGVWGTCALRSDHSVWCWGTLSPDRQTAMPQRVVW